jgi:glucose/arabinose dehydrogenase
MKSCALALAMLTIGWHASLPARSVDGPPVPDLPPVSAAEFKRPVVVGWNETKTPAAPPGFRVERFADGLQSGRWPYVLPNGDVLVAQARTESMGGFPPELLKAFIENGWFGPSADNIVLLRRTQQGIERSIFIDGLNQPFGMLLLDEFLYVANTDSLVRFRYRDGMTRIDAPPEKLLDIPAGEQTNPWNNHWTRNLVATPDGERIMLSVGSGTDVDAEGVDPPDRAAIWELKPDGSGKRLFATGLRNPVGLDFEPFTGSLWTTVNERDGLGPDLPPDYLTEVVDGGFYGWPYVYYGRYPDPTQSEINPDKVAAAQDTARVPDLALGGHSVPLGLLFYRGGSFPAKYRRGAFVVRRAGVGSSVFHGPDVIFLPFENGRPTGSIESFLTGFVADEQRGEVHGRPVGMAMLQDGSLLITDDGANVIWRVVYDGSTGDRTD